MKDDDDQEDYDAKDLRKALTLYKSNKVHDKVSRVTGVEGEGVEGTADETMVTETAEATDAPEPADDAAPSEEAAPTAPDDAAADA